MEVKSIIKKCLETIGAEDFTSSQQLSGEQQNLLERLMNCLNLTYLEICSDILPTSGSEKVTVGDGIIDLAQFSERVTKIKKILKDGIPCDFTVYPTYIATDAIGEVEAVYEYTPPELKYTDYIDDINLKLVTMVYGTLGKYYFENGMYDLSSFWEDKFDKSIKKVKYSKTIVLPKRRWI